MSAQKSPALEKKLKKTPRKNPTPDEVRDELYEANERIIASGKRRLAEAVETLSIEKPQDLKILSDVVETCLRQNETLRDPDRRESDPIELLLSCLRDRSGSSSTD